MDDKVKATGVVTVSLNGKVVQVVDNLVVTAGKEWIAARMATADTMTHMGIGTGTTAAAIGDTALETEITTIATRNALNVPGGNVSGATITYEASWGADDPDITAPTTTDITEAGIFTASSGGTMLARAILAVINKGETDSMTISWVITIS